jgi:arylsulfatase A-like enzyme
MDEHQLAGRADAPVRSGGAAGPFTVLPRSAVKGDDVNGWTFWKVPALALLVGVLGGVIATGRLFSLEPSAGEKEPAAGEKAPAKVAPPGSPAATQSLRSMYLPFPKFPEVKFGGKIGINASDSKPFWTPRVVPPKGAPNVLLIMTDDVGFGAPSTFGGVIPTPTMDKIAKMGLRYNNLCSTALCSPTRAAIMTGRNHHSCHFGVITEMSTGFPGYDSMLDETTATIAAILRQYGYATGWWGKNHNTPSFEYSLAGPFTRWPTGGYGFDYFYGFLGGDSNQWTPFLYRNTTPIFPFEKKKDFNLITEMANDAIRWLGDLHATDPAKPFFMYYVPGGTHAPHHPTPEWIAKFKGKFDNGWNDLREQIFKNQQRLGIIPKNAKLTPWPKDLPEWNTLNADEKKLFAKQAEVYAAYLAYTDHEIGRVVQAIEDMGKLDNTLIIYVSGDNGCSAEGSPIGSPNEVAVMNTIEFPVDVQLKRFYDVWGSDRTYPHMSCAWAWAFSTPFKWMKQIAAFFGGTRQGTVICWPKRIKDKEGIREQFCHVIDIVPTILEACGIPEPVSVNGVPQRPIEGTSMVYTFDKKNAKAKSRHTTQYFEMLGNCGIYHEGWIASAVPFAAPWQLSRWQKVLAQNC